MILHLVVQVLLFPSLLARSPFDPWVSPALSLALGRWIVPLLLAALSAGVVWIRLGRTRRRSIIGTYFIYAAVDSLLALIIYVALPMS
jgi:hypothetical protein